MSDEAFEREKACYEQNFEQARCLNGQMNNVPVLAMTLTGGLWFAAGINEDISKDIRFLLLLFAGFCNLSLILVIIRIRDVFHSYLERIGSFHPESFATGKPGNPKVPALGDYSMISIYCALLALAALLSFGTAMFSFWPIPYVPTWIGVLILLIILLCLFDLLISQRLLRFGSSRNSGQGRSGAD